MAKIAFIGLGNMGLPMAINLVKAGHEVNGFDLVPAAIEAAGNAGIKVMPAAAESLEGVEIVVTMLPNGKLVLGVYNDILKAAAPGTLFIDLSLIHI